MQQRKDQVSLLQKQTDRKIDWFFPAENCFFLLRTDAEVDIGEVVKIGRIVDTFDVDIHGGRTISQMIPVNALEEAMLLDFGQAALVSNSTDLFTTKSVNNNRNHQ